MNAAINTESTQNPALCVDLDGTLINSDLLHESVFSLLRHHPLLALAVPFWLSRGKATLKRELAEKAQIEAAGLPYNLALIEWLKEQKRKGRYLVLSTASDEKFALAVAKHLGIFDEVMSSDGDTNLAGKNKAASLIDRFGERGFDYAGNSTTDMKVWAHARRAIVVNAKASLAQSAAKVCEVERVFPKPKTGLKVWLRMFRVHQWMKNVLLAVPLLASHQLDNMAAWQNLLMAFLALSLCASSIYIFNDLLDLESDRRHPRKRKRPFASGALPIELGVALMPLLLAASFMLGKAVNPSFLAWLVAYFTATTAYSFWLKRVALVDCLMLAGLYTLRIVAGAAAIKIALTFWLLAFSVFLFLSLAFVKRYAELLVHAGEGGKKVHGRSYLIEDAPLVQALGIASGYGAVLVLALYLNSDTVLRLYATPEWIWGAVPVMLYWISWIWLCAHRGKMHDDPMVFAVKERPSLLAGALFILVLVLGTIKWPW